MGVNESMRKLDLGHSNYGVEQRDKGMQLCHQSWGGGERQGYTAMPSELGWRRETRVAAMSPELGWGRETRVHSYAIRVGVGQRDKGTQLCHQSWGGAERQGY